MVPFPLLGREFLYIAENYWWRFPGSGVAPMTIRMHANQCSVNSSLRFHLPVVANDLLLSKAF